MEKQEKNTITDKDIINMLFKEIDEPKNIYKIKVINIFENAYRINVWSENYDEISKLNKIKISHSYFCKLNNGKLKVHD